MEKTYTITLRDSQARRLLTNAYHDWAGEDYRRFEDELRQQGFWRAEDAEPKHLCTGESDEDCPCVEAHIEDGGCYEVVSDNPPERNEGRE